MLLAIVAIAAIRENIIQMSCSTKETTFIITQLMATVTAKELNLNFYDSFNYILFSIVVLGILFSSSRHASRCESQIRSN